MTEPVHIGLQKIIEHLKNLDNSEKSACGFDMSRDSTYAVSTAHPCGTACCIGGHAALILKMPTLSPEAALTLLCDIPHTTADELCWPPTKVLPIGYMTEITLEEAVNVLEHCRDTGEVDWSAVRARIDSDRGRNNAKAN